MRSVNRQIYKNIGVEYNFQRNDIKEKIKQTDLQKYGVEHYTNRDKAFNTFKLHYGVDNIFQLDEIKEKIKRDNLQKYGVEHSWQRPDVKEKIRQTNLAKYGVEHVMQNHDIRVKSQSKYRFANTNFDSSAELAYYIWLRDNNIQFTFHPDICFEYIVNGKTHYYHPDFLVGNTYQEIKGVQFFKNKDANSTMINPYDRSQDDVFEAKHKCMLDNNVEIITDHSKYYQYVDDTYTKDFLKLFKNNIEFPYPTDTIISKYHHSIYDARKYNYMSPREAWCNKNVILKSALNRLTYVNSCTPKDVLRGFSVAKLAPKVSVFKRSLAEHIVNTYLYDVNEIFDPFSGFSGRMLGACDCGKTYVGQDINEIHVQESNNIIKDFALKATVICKDIFESSGQYESLFTCSPYRLKEIWNENEIDLSCDEWIGECLKRFDCRKYVFVVDETEKYKDCIVETIENKSHFGLNKEYIIIIEE